MLDVVLRYQSIKIDEDVVTSARPSEFDGEAFERANQTAADEEDMYVARSAKAVEAAAPEAEATAAIDAPAEEGKE